VKKVALLVTGAGAALAMGIVGASHAAAEPPDVTGETYGNAQAILQAQGIQAVFGGSVGSDLPQSQCIVIEQTGQGSTIWNRPMGSYGTMRLRLDCNLAKGQEMPKAPNTHSLVPPGGSVVGPDGTVGAGPGATEGPRPTSGAGTVTVTPKRIG
jgi:PASTA domain